MKTLQNYSLLIKSQIFQILYHKLASNPVILATTTKTGTHYLRLCLAYYINNLYDLGFQNDSTILDLIFPNSWHSSYTFNRKFIESPIRKIKDLFFNDIPRSHMSYKKAWNKNKVIHTFRNPLDQSVVLFFTKFNLFHKNPYKSPFDLFIQNNDSLIHEYDSFKLMNKNSNIRRISFECLINAPNSNIQPLLNFLNIPMDIKLIEEATNFASSFPLACIGGFENGTGLEL